MFDDISHELELLRVPIVDLEKYKRPDRPYSPFDNIELHGVLTESKKIAFRQLYRLRERKLGSTHEGYKHIILSLKRLLEYDISMWGIFSNDDYRDPMNQIQFFIERRGKLLDRIFKFLEDIFCIEDRHSFLTHRDKRNLVRPLFIHLDDIERLYLNDRLYETISQLKELDSTTTEQEAVA